MGLPDLATWAVRTSRCPGETVVGLRGLPAQGIGAQWPRGIRARGGARPGGDWPPNVP